MLKVWKLTWKWSGWISDSYCSLNPLWSGMGNVVLARTSPTLHPPSLPTVHLPQVRVIFFLYYSSNSKGWQDNDAAPWWLCTFQQIKGWHWMSWQHSMTTSSNMQQCTLFLLNLNQGDHYNAMISRIHLLCLANAWVLSNPYKTARILILLRGQGKLFEATFAINFVCLTKKELSLLTH